MYSKNYRPTAAQLRFWNYVANQAPVFAEGGGLVQLHRVLGASAKHQGVHIGQWVVMPVTEQGHRIVEKLPKKEQVQIYLKEVLEPYWVKFNELPMSADELMAIATWSR